MDICDVSQENVGDTKLEVRLLEKMEIINSVGLIDEIANKLLNAD